MGGRGTGALPLRAASSGRGGSKVEASLGSSDGEKSNSGDYVSDWSREGLDLVLVMSGVEVGCFLCLTVELLSG